MGEPDLESRPLDSSSEGSSEVGEVTVGCSSHGKIPGGSRCLDRWE